LKRYVFSQNQKTFASTIKFKIMNKTLPLYLLAFVSLFTISCGDSCIEGDGISTTLSDSLDAFDEIDNTGIVEVRIAYGTDYSYVLTGDSNIVTEVELNSNGGVLSIGTRANCINNASSLILEIFTPLIKEIKNDGTGDVIGSTIFEDLLINNSGTGDVSLNGNKINSISIDNDGTGDIKLFDLESSTMTLTSTGTGDCFVNVSDNLTVEMTGTGDVSYKGNPIIDSDISGTGDLIDAN